MTRALAAAINPGRRHDIDAIRVLAFGLLILYHVGMFYVSWPWHVKSVHTAAWLEPLMLLVNQWRMPLIFLVSGLAVNFLRRRVGDGELARRRLVRLGVPLLFGMLVIIPPQAYLEALARGAVESGYAHFLWRYFSFQAWPAGAFLGSEFRITWNHLWYLPYLLCYTLALIALARWLNRPIGAVRRGCDKLRGWSLIVVPVLPLLLSGLLVYPYFPGMTFDLLDDWYAHSQFFTFFFYGYLLGTSEPLWAELERLRRRTLAIAVASYLTLLLLYQVLPEEHTAAEHGALLVVVYLNRWIWLATVLGWGHHLLNRPFRWLPYANEAVYPWYVLHQTLTVVAAWWLSTRALGPVLEPVLVLAATLGGCALLHECLIRRVRWLRPLFGLQLAPAQRPVALTDSCRECA